MICENTVREEFARGESAGGIVIVNLPTDSNVIRARVERVPSPGVHSTKRRSGTAGGVSSRAQSRTATARETWEIANAMFRRGLGVLRPLLFTAQRHAQESRQQLLFSEDIAPAVSLTKFVQQASRRDDPALTPARLNECALRLADQLRRMHAFGFRHTELHADNILIAETGPIRQSGSNASGAASSRLNTAVIGLHAVVRVRRISRQDVHFVLHVLNASLPAVLVPMSVRLRFLIHFLQADSGRWKSDWRAIAHEGRAR
ncbi:MAG: hypothetical protein IID45_07240 [Planctomycetes bacterium]|nr:hypothetical protein [Planctomycetota bacterium]